MRKIYDMPDTVRKEVKLDKKTISELTKKAKKEKRSLKNYMEKVLMVDAEIK